MTRRWATKLGQCTENSAIDRFLAEYKELCEKHGFAFSHEDEHGAFIIEKNDEILQKWASQAMVGDTIE